MLLASIYEERSTTQNTNTSEDDGGNVDEENGDGDIPLETITDDNEIQLDGFACACETVSIVQSSQCYDY